MPDAATRSKQSPTVATRLLSNPTASLQERIFRTERTAAAARDVALLSPSTAAKSIPSTLDPAKALHRGTTTA